MALTCQLCGSVEGGFRKETMASASLSFWEKADPSSCLDAKHFSSPCMLLVLFKFLPWCWSSEGLNLSESVFKLFKRNCLGLQKFLLLTQSSPGFAARNYGDLSSWHLSPGLGGLVWSWNTSFLRCTY